MTNCQGVFRAISKIMARLPKESGVRGRGGWARFARMTPLTVWPFSRVPPVSLLRRVAGGIRLIIRLLLAPFSGVPPVSLLRRVPSFVSWLNVSSPSSTSKFNRLSFLTQSHNPHPSQQGGIIGIARVRIRLAPLPVAAFRRRSLLLATAFRRWWQAHSESLSRLQPDFPKASAKALPSPAEAGSLN